MGRLKHVLMRHTIDMLTGPRDYVQVDALLNSTRGGAPVVDWIVSQFEELGYASWAHRIINTAGAVHNLMQLAPVLGAC